LRGPAARAKVIADTGEGELFGQNGSKRFLNIPRAFSPVSISPKWAEASKEAS
jgi:hypothetical protein